MIGKDFVVCDVAGQWWAVPLDAVCRIVRAVALARVPEASPDLLGLMNLHGTLVPVYDLRHAFGLPPKSLAPDDRFVILDDGSGPVGLRADAVCRIGPVELEANDPCRRLFAGQRNFFCAVGKCEGQTVLMLDVKGFHREGHRRGETVKESSVRVIEMTHEGAVPRPRTGESGPGDEALVYALPS